MITIRFIEAMVEIGRSEKRPSDSELRDLTYQHEKYDTYERNCSIFFSELPELEVLDDSDFADYIAGLIVCHTSSDFCRSGSGCGLYVFLNRCLNNAQFEDSRNLSPEILKKIAQIGMRLKPDVMYRDNDEFENLFSKATTMEMMMKIAMEEHE